MVDSSKTSPTVPTTSGKVRGLVHKNVFSFRGIPYIQPRIGSSRFQAPVEHSGWTGVLECVSPGPIAPQNVFELEKIAGVGEFPQDEDCLTLNVWTPDLSGHLPVMVWIHGGAFATGTGRTPWYDGTRLASKDNVVVITINYRLGTLGFCYLKEANPELFATSGINGILDQVQALKWVRDNVAVFGGDPANVTVFGESAGAMSVGTLLGLPQASGLFRRAILESGACSHSATPDRATEISDQMLKALELTPGEANKICEIPVAQILEAQKQVTDLRGAYLSFQPVVDGEILPRSPLESVRQGMVRGVDLIVGTNEEEMKLFGIDDPELMNVDEQKMISQMTTLGGHIFDEKRSKEVIEAYRSHYRGLDLGALWFQMLTDYVFRMPATRLVEAQSEHANTYYYLFRWASPSFGGLIGSSHSLEIPFVFDNLDKPGVDLFTGGEAAEGRENVATAMSEAWTGFATNSTPVSSRLPSWPTFNTDRRATMVFDISHQVEYDQLPEIRAIWDDVDFRFI